jgi:hypothetical protein
MASAIVVGASLAVLLGLVLVIVAWRGKRVDDHPVCARCRYDLSGLGADQGQCPECGQDLTRDRAQRTGNCRKRPVVLAGGMMLTIAALGALGASLLLIATSANWQKQKPAWWLNYEMQYLGKQRANAALDEIMRRLDNGALTKPQVRPILDTVLTWQGDRSKPWDPKWGNFIEKAHGKGLTTQAQITRYAKQAIVGAWRLKVRPRVSVGGSVPYRLIERGARVGDIVAGDRPWVRTAIRRVRIGEITAREHGSSGSPLSASGGGWHGSTFGFDQKQLDRFEPGGATARVKLEVSVKAPGGRTRKNVFKTTQTLAADFTFVPADQSIVTAVDDPKLASAVRQSLMLKDITYDARASRSLRGDIKISSPPTGIAFDITARDPQGRTWDLTGISAKKREETNWGFGDWGIDGFNARRIDLILEPSAEQARTTMDVVEYWGRRIVYRDVKVKWRGGQPPATQGRGSAATQASSAAAAEAAAP